MIDRAPSDVNLVNLVPWNTPITKSDIPFSPVSLELQFPVPHVTKNRETLNMSRREFCYYQNQLNVFHINTIRFTPPDVHSIPLSFPPP